ncbi:FAD binding domain-containing protein [Bacillus sp. FJAT-50079]|uniref:FAD binding domain-containing protein n=1 Tax=Bacillus sp. FJAT-50079 TaxID=2833577 RepID=UPI001BCA4A3B|nr:FAD binding domain-containing protein [Bacillus sp. FJAT-50079]MBS4210273.1 FAD binding domain-containing protein [Bacillus sp. FJAT-50079]
MIPFDFEYYRPASIKEAIETYEQLQADGKTIVYISGGTEFITFSRVNQMNADAVIDIKGIPECTLLEEQDDQLVMGSAVSLNTITESGLFPLLGEKLRRIADHTSRNKITIGGNLNSHFIYREGVLPLLISDAQVKIAGMDEEEILPLETLKLEQGQFLTQIFVDKAYVDLPFKNVKKTKVSTVAYPIVSISALVKEKQMRVAMSGVCEYPFRSIEIERVINDFSRSAEERVNEAIGVLPGPVIGDIEASAPYREFVLKQALSETIAALEGEIQ